MSDLGRGRRIWAVVAAVAAVAVAAGCTAQPTPKPDLVAVGTPKVKSTPGAPKVLAQIRTHNTLHETMVVAERTEELYVSGHNPNSVAVIDMASRRFLKRIPIDEPSDMAVEEATGRIYVATQNHVEDRHYVDVIDTASHTVVQRLRFELPANNPGGGHRMSRLAIDPPNNHLFVVTQAWKPLVSVFDTKTGAAVRTIPIDGSPYDVAVDSKHGVAFISKRTDGRQDSSITLIDTRTLRVIDTIEGPDGGEGYANLAVDEESGTLFAGGWRWLTIIDPVSRKLLRTIRLGGQAEHSWAAFDRSARRAYFTALDGIAVIDLTNLRRVELLTHPTLKAGQRVPRTVAVDPATGAVFSTLRVRTDDRGHLLDGVVTVLARS